MNDFNYYMPSKVIWGTNCLKNQGGVIRSIGKRALVITGKKSARSCGVLDDITECLGGNAILFDVFNDIEPNPSIATARRAAEAARTFRADMIVAAGGGSPLDAGKAAAVLAGNDLADDDLFAGKFSGAVLPLVAIPTTAGTGSEVTPYSILTDPLKKTKRNLKTEKIFPVLAFLDSRYTDSLPLKVTAHTAIDALTHAVEGYLSSRAMPVADTFALRAVSMIGAGLSALSAKTPDRHDRDRFLFASMLAGCVIAQTGTTVLHAMGYHLTFFHNVEHGRANGLLLVPYLHHVMKAQPERVHDILRMTGCADLAGLEKIINPLLGGGLNLTNEEIAEFSRVASETPGAASTIPRPSIDDIRSMFENVMRA